MKRRRSSEEQIIGILKEHEAGVSVADLYIWGMDEAFPLPPWQWRPDLRLHKALSFKMSYDQIVEGQRHALLWAPGRP